MKSFRAVLVVIAALGLGGCVAGTEDTVDTDTDPVADTQEPLTAVGEATQVETAGARSADLTVRRMENFREYPSSPIVTHEGRPSHTPDTPSRAENGPRAE
jgi:hypothetical protein